MVTVDIYSHVHTLAMWLTRSEERRVAQEELPLDMPKPRGKGMDMRVYVDSDHTGYTVACISRTGFVIFLNGAPIYWNYKKQNSCETSYFGSELCAMKPATEYVKGFRYKLIMMGIPVEDPTFIFGNNHSMLANTTMPESMLKKKTQSIAHQLVQEGCAHDEGEMHTSALTIMLLTCWQSLYPQGRSVGNLYGCYSTIWHHRVCDGVTLTVGQGALFRGGLQLYLSWLKGISGEILLQYFYFCLSFFLQSQFFRSSYGLHEA